MPMVDLNIALGAVVALTRILELIGIVITIFLIFKGYKLRYAIYVGIVVIVSLIISFLGLINRQYFIQITLADIAFTTLALAGIVYYVIKNPEKTRDFTPSGEVRCPVCNVLILKEDELCTVKIGDYTYFLDSCDHLVKLFENAEFLLKRKSIYKGEIKEAFVKTVDTKRWKKLDDVKIVEEDGKYKAYENPPASAKVLNVKELINKAKNVLG